MATLPLDSRQAGIARALLAATDPTTIAAVASNLRLTERMVRYDLGAVAIYLAERGLPVTRRRGLGIWVDAPEADRRALADELARPAGPIVLDAEDRQSLVLLAVLEAAPEPLRLEELEGRLGVSRPTVRRDVRLAEGWLEQHRLHLRRMPGVGVGVRGSEVDVRAAILALLLERVPAEVLSSAAESTIEGQLAAKGLGSYVESLDLHTFRRVLVAELPDIDDRDPTLLTATLGLAVAIRRLRADRPARLGRGRLRSLLDHPVSDDAQRIAVALSGETGVALASTEVAAITESLLGFAELGSGGTTPEVEIVAAVDRIVAAAGDRLAPSLASDELLRINLTEHLRRLAVRLRYGLPVSNPLQQEVRKRYPDVYEVAGDIVAAQRALAGALIPTEEVGLLTMYLAGSLERLRLRPKIQVTVVCPAGMATVWILVSRLLSEFPQVEVAQVVSKTVYERDPESVATDFIVSTVPLDTVPSVPFLLVNPLLHDGDVRRLARMLGLPAQH